MSRSNNPASRRASEISFSLGGVEERFLSSPSFLGRDLIVGVDSSWIYGSEYRVLHTVAGSTEPFDLFLYGFNLLKFDGCPKRFIDEFQRQFTRDRRIATDYFVVRKVFAHASVAFTLDKTDGNAADTFFVLTI